VVVVLPSPQLCPSPRILILGTGGAVVALASTLIPPWALGLGVPEERVRSRLLGLEVSFFGRVFLRLCVGRASFLGGARSCLCVCSRRLLLFPLQGPGVRLGHALPPTPKPGDGLGEERGYSSEAEPGRWTGCCRAQPAPRGSLQPPRPLASLSPALPWVLIFAN